MDEAQRRRQILANSAYLEVRSHALIVHSQALIARAQRLRAQSQRTMEHASDVWFSNERTPSAVWPRSGEE